LNKGQIKVIPNSKEFNGGYNQQDPDSDKIISDQPSGEEVYEEQYDPNQEFRIFGVGDKTKGGIQSLQEKMNMADDVDSDKSSESERGQDNRSSVAPLKDSIGSLNHSKTPPNP